MFALGCTIYFIMMEHPVSTDINEKEEAWREKVEEKARLSTDTHACAFVTSKCWRQEYASTEDIVRDIAFTQKSFEEEKKKR